MERQQEYELRKKIADAIQNDVDRVFSEKLQLFNHDFYYEILFPLIVLEMNYKMKSEESLAAGLGDSNEYLILVNPLREAIYWYIHRVLISDRKISFSKKRYVPSLGEEYSFVEYVLQLHDEFKRGEQIREIRDCASKVMIKPEDDNTYGFYFPVISEKYHKELLYYYGLDDTLNFEVEKEIFVECEKYLHDKINVKELIKHPQKIYIFYNILNRMANVIDTKYFELCKKRVMSDLNYEDVWWLVDSYGLIDKEDAEEELMEYYEQENKLHCYIKSIISNPSISEREKLVILLSHIEPLIYNTLNYTKQPYSKVKQIVKRMSIDENEGMSSESVGKLYVMGITYVVFANTDAYTKEIDKRIPFRNNILHNGIVEYGTDDIHSAYELLVEFISMLVFIKKQLINEKTK